MHLFDVTANQGRVQHTTFYHFLLYSQHRPLWQQATCSEALSREAIGWCGFALLMSNKEDGKQERGEASYPVTIVTELA